MSVEGKINYTDLIKIIDSKSGPTFLKSVRNKWDKTSQIQIGEIQRDEMSGRPGLNRISGDLARSLFPKTTITASDVNLKWFSGNPYIAVHQYGAIIKAKAGEYLTFKITKGVYAASIKTRQVRKVKTLTNWVRVKQVTIPKRLHIIERFQDPGTELRKKDVIEAMKEITT